MLKGKAKEVIKVDKVTSMRQMREILQIVNFYVRDRDMGEVLRRSLLTTSSMRLQEGNWDT